MEKTEGVRKNEMKSESNVKKRERKWKKTTWMSNDIKVDGKKNRRVTKKRKMEEDVRKEKTKGTDEDRERKQRMKEDKKTEKEH